MKFKLMPSTLKSPRWIVVALVTVVVIAAAWVWREEAATLVHFLKDKDAISHYLEPMGLWGPLLYVVLLCLEVVTIIIPGHALMFAAGYVYGFEKGLLLNIIGAVGASQLAFVISRYAGQDFVPRIIPAKILNRWEKIVKRQGMVFFMISFWFPIIPSNLTNYVAGLSPISFWAFLGANFVGRVPGLIFITLFGAYGFELSPEQWIVAAIAAGLGIVGGRFIAAKLERLYAPGSIQ